MEYSLRSHQKENTFLEWNSDGHIQRTVITQNGLLIGRDPNADICLTSTQASWHHVRVDWVDGSCIVTDLGSTNGTFLNGQRASPGSASRLHLTDDLCICGLVFRLIVVSAIAGTHPTQMMIPPALATLIVIGRSVECDIVLTDPDVSWLHARLTKRAQEWHLEDLGSRNGTWVNERRITACTVKVGDRVRIGLNRFSLDESQISYVSDVGQVQLEAIGLTRTVWKDGRSLTLLRDVSLRIEPRKLVAIVGGSGAGKTTLLLALNGYQPATSGCVQLNGVDYYAHSDLFRTVIGYVPQADIVHADLRVESALRYAARLRLPPDTTDAEVTTLVVRVLEDMSLTHRRNSFVRTLSGGERKRVNIGVELLTRPSLLFLDEPTTGLDAGLERRIVRQLRALADEGRTVVVVTHSVQTLDEYDAVAVMARGGVLAYYGSPKDAPQFFGVSDFAGIYDRINQSGMTGISWGDHQPQVPAATSLNSHRPAPALPKVSAVGQLSALLARYAEVIRSDTRNLISWAVQAPTVALIIAILFHSNIFSASQLPDAKGNIPIQDAPRLLFLLAFSVVCFGLCNSARELVKEQDIYRRERHVALKIVPYILSKIIILSLVSFCQCLTLLLVVSLKVDFCIGNEGLTWMIGLLFLGSVGAILLGLLISAWASSSDQAVSLVAVLLLLQVIFSGLIPLENMPSIFQALAALCITRWTYGGICGTTKVAQRWTDVGLASQVHDLFRTQSLTAMIVLIAMSFGLFAALWSLLVTQDKRRR